MISCGFPFIYIKILVMVWPIHKWGLSPLFTILHIVQNVNINGGLWPMVGHLLFQNSIHSPNSFLRLF